MYMELGLMIGGDVPEVKEENKKRAEEYWMYGSSAEELGKAWGKPTKVAELKTCANCEYFNNKARTLKALNAEPGTGACMKFKFICSQEAACQGWDCPSHMDMPDEDDY